MPATAIPATHERNERSMDTIYDWVTVVIFGALAILFLQRSMGPGRSADRTIYYLPPALGCAGANYLGNNDLKWAAIALTIAVVGYILFVLKPFDRAES
jgi:hypothetical protein